MKTRLVEGNNRMNRKILLEPTKNPWESLAVLNPTALKVKGIIHLLYRAIQSPNHSCLGRAKIENGKLKRYKNPCLKPTTDYESEGVEDPRLVKLGNTYHLLYTAWDGRNARIALATSADLKHFEKKGVISPNITLEEAIKVVGSRRYKKRWKKEVKDRNLDAILYDKDGVLFSEKINGRYAMLHRLEPDIQIVYFDSFEDLQSKEFWLDYLKNIEEYIVMRPKFRWEQKKVGAGATPIKTNQGWLLLYHGVDKEETYNAGVALLDLKHPEIELARLAKPLFKPEYEWEKQGVVDNIVFPEGAVRDNGSLNVFYGCADSRVGVARVNFKELMDNLAVEVA